jgi:hypothetical protein
VQVRKRVTLCGSVHSHLNTRQIYKIKQKKKRNCYDSK